MNSAVPDFGSKALTVSWLVSTSPGKWNVMKARSSPRQGSTRTGASTSPRRDRTRTTSPSRTPKRAAVPGMKKRGWGRIINTASAHSLVASPFKAAYVSAKHGIAGLTKTVALELATFKITCNCISPGYVWTPLVEHQIPETMKARNLTKEQVIKDVLLAAQPTKEFVTSDQVAALALFLCSDDAAQITGSNYSIDGGWTAA